MNVYMFRINDRPYGFRVVAMVASSEDDAKASVSKRWGVDFNAKEPWRTPRADLVDSCEELSSGDFVEMEFQE